LIPVQLQDCTGSAGEKFDFITAGVHVSLDILIDVYAFEADIRRTTLPTPRSWSRVLLRGV
jgi:hypothetical protein